MKLVVASAWLSSAQQAGIAISVVGLLIALRGAYVGSSVPLLDLIDESSTFGGGRTEVRDMLKMAIHSDWVRANALLVVGTACQIIGAFLSALGARPRA